MMSLDAAPNGLTPHGKSNEWYTPSKYIEAARDVMGGIDLDPASCAVANETVKARRYYSKEDDGLTQEWYGNVWLNPPFSTTSRSSNGLFKSGIGRFTSKGVEEYLSGNVKQLILLTMPNTQTQWFQPLWRYPMCFTDHSLKFDGPRYSTTRRNQAMFGTVFVYLGPNEQSFITIFSQFGTIAKRVNPVVVQEPPPTLWEVRA